MTDEPSGVASLTAQLQGDLAALDSELAEIQLLIGQTRSEAQRHEQKRVQAADKLSNPKRGPVDDPAEAYGTLVTMTRRATLMEAQVDVLEGKHKALVRHRAAIAAVLERLAELPAERAAPAGKGSRSRSAAGTGAGSGAESSDTPESLPPSISRVVHNAQEDLRRDIARAMHDGPAQSLTNIVLQAQIVERLVDKDPAYARGEARLLVSMVQQTLEATKGFIFDVRPMVLDDLGLVPTLRRSTRERGRRSHIPVEFESVGQEQRLPIDVESAVFRMLDEAMSAYLAQGPERVVLRLDWADALEARLSAHRTAILPAATLGAGQTPGGDVPNALRQMIQDREDARQAAVVAAEEAAIVPLPAATRRDVQSRAASIDATAEFLAGGGEMRLVVTLPVNEGTGADR
jgi:two-component system, NarL family, sensor histidine kinase DegS